MSRIGGLGGAEAGVGHRSLRSHVLSAWTWRMFVIGACFLAPLVAVLAATNDNNVENTGGQPRHVSGEEAWTGAGFNMRNPSNVDDLDAPFFYVSVWANDITSARFNTSANGWADVYAMVYDSDHDAKSYWRTAAGIAEVLSQDPGTVVYYDFKLTDGTSVGWLKSDGFFGVTGVGTPFSFTVEGATAQPYSVTADSSATSTISAWVTNAGQPVQSEVVTFTFVSGPGAFVSTNNQTATASTDASGKATVQVRSGTAGMALIQASSTNFNDSGDTSATVTFASFLTDGNPSDFPGDSTGMSSNDSRVSGGTFIWKDALNDERTTSIDPTPTGSSSNYDLDVFKIAATTDSFRALATFRDIEAGRTPFVLIAIDSDVRRDTSTSVTTAGPGPATSTKDFGNWWLPANSFTGTRHSGAATPAGRGERGQRDSSAAAVDNAFMPNRWTVDGAALDADNESTAVSNNQQSVLATRRDAGAGGPSRLNWDYNQNTNELYVGISPWNGGTADYFIWVANDTTAATSPAQWTKAGVVMASDDWRFNRGTSGDWFAITNRLGSADYDVASGATSTQSSAGGDTDDDNRDLGIVGSAGGIPLEGTVDLNQLFGSSGITNGSVFITASSYETNNNDDGGGGRGEQWDQVPGQGADNTVGHTEWQQVWLEIPSASGDEQIAEWERAIAFTNIAPGGGKSATSVWDAPGGMSLGSTRREVGNSYASEANNAFEYDITWANLLGTGARPPFTLRFTVAVGEGINGGGDQFDNYRYMRTFRNNASSTFGEISSELDCISGATAATELSDQDIDYFVDVDFNKDGRINTTPDTPTNLGITQTGDTTVHGSGVILNDATPIFSWSVNDTDGSLAAQSPAWQLQVDNDPAFGSVALEKISINTDSTAATWTATSSIATGDTFYWRIRMRDDFGWSPWSKGSDFAFRINSAPSAPSVRQVNSQTNPTNVANNLPRFTWAFGDSDPNDAQSGFAIEVWKGGTRIFAETKATTNQYEDYPDTGAALEGGVMYYWSVRTKDLNGLYGANSDSTGTYFQIVFDSASGLRNVVIAEIGNGYATTAGQDYLELYNPNDTTVQLKGASLQYVAVNSGTFRKWIFSSMDSIPAYSYYLFTSWNVAGRDSFSANFAFTAGQGHVFALMRNSIQIDTPQTADTDIIDAVGINQTADGTNVPVGSMNANDELIMRKSTSASNVVLGMRRDSDLHRAGSYFDNNSANDWDNATGVAFAELKGVSFGQSRIKFALTSTPVTYVEAGVPFTLTITATDANGWKVSDTPASSMTGNSRLTITQGSVSPTTTTDTFQRFSTSNVKNGVIAESVTITGFTGSCTVTADTTYGVDTTGPGPINGTIGLTVQTAQAPTKPVISAPINGSYQYNPVTVTWSASTDSTPPVQYRVQVDDSSAFNSPVADTYTYSTSLALGTLNVPDSFWVRVIALDPGGNSDTSTVVTFRAVYQVSLFALSETDPALLVASRTVRRGQAFNLRIIAKDASGNTVTTFKDTVTLSVARGTISPTTVVFTQAWNGDTTCSVTISGGGAIGADTITADSSGLVGRVVVYPLSDNRLIINEVLPTDTNPGVNGDDRDEWVEIYNRSTGTVSTAGWLYTEYDANSETNIPAVSIPSDKYLVLHRAESGVNDVNFTDTDGAAHIFPYVTTLNLLATADRSAIYSSTTKDSSTVVSYVAWANANTDGTIGNDDSDAVGAGIWPGDNVTFNHGSTPSGLSGLPIFRSVNGRDTNQSTADWAIRGVTDTYTFTEGFANNLFDTDLTGVTISFLSASGLTDSVGIGETLAIKLTATGGGNPGVQGVTTVLVKSQADDLGIVVTLLESTPGSRIYMQEVTVVSITDSGSRDGHRWIGVNSTDTVTATWVKGGDSAVTVVPSPLHHFDVTGVSNVSNDFSFALTITARTLAGAQKEDYVGTVNVTLTSGSIVPTSVTFVGSDSGAAIATFTISGAALGSDTITVTESVTGETGRIVVNVEASPDIVINEIMPLPAVIDWDGNGLVDVNQDEWVEIFNRTNGAIGLASWKVGGIGASKVTLSDTIETRGYLVVYRKASGSARGFFFNSNGVVVRSMTFGGGALGPLNNGGDRVILLNAAGDTISDVTYPAQSSDSAYVRSWDGAGVFRSSAHPTPGADSPTLPTSARDTSANMRFRIDGPDSALLNESTTLRILAVDAAGETVTNFTSSGISVTALSGPTINISSVSFTSGICSTSIRFGTATGTTILKVQFETNTVGYDSVTVLPALVTDTTPPAKPTGFTATAILVGVPAQDTGVRLTWTSNTETDVAQYKLYRNSVNDTRAGGMTLIFTGVVSDSIRLDSSVLPNDTAYYYLVTIDSVGNISDTAGGVTAPDFTIQKTIDSTSLGLLPGSSILYRLAVLNAGWGPADSVVVMDTIAANMIYRDTVTSVVDWEFQYCTSSTPSQAFYSANYVSGVPVVASDVRFVRWRKLRVTAGEPIAVLRFRSIVE